MFQRPFGTPNSAEASLNNVQKNPGHLLVVLQLVADSNSSNYAIRQAAAVHFKNVVKKGWDPSQEVRDRRIDQVLFVRTVVHFSNAIL